MKGPLIVCGGLPSPSVACGIIIVMKLFRSSQALPMQEPIILVEGIGHLSRSCDCIFCHTLPFARSISIFVRENHGSTAHVQVVGRQFLAASLPVSPCIKCRVLRGGGVLRTRSYVIFIRSILCVPVVTFLFCLRSSLYVFSWMSLKDAFVMAGMGWTWIVQVFFEWWPDAALECGKSDWGTYRGSND